MKAVAVIAAFALLAVASAHCPNSCSGHGTCGQYDKCSCWANWQGGDCSERTCAFGNAWSQNLADPHYYAECSNKGICDRESGDCVCFPEFSGRACERLSCPNDCSGHGKCRYITDLSAAASYAGWDATKVQTCVCDGGFFGPDCSQRYCPYGDDPLTVCNTDNTQIQRLELEFGLQTAGGRITPAGDDRGVDNDRAPEGDVDVQDLALKFTDSYGETWKTQRIENVWDNDTAITNIGNALKALPNHAIPDVTVSINADRDVNWRKSYLITFSDDRTSGDQNLLACHDDPLGCPAAGCQPQYGQLRMVDKFVDVFANWNQVNMNANSVLTKDASKRSGGFSQFEHDANITITIYNNDSHDVFNYFDGVGLDDNDGYHSYSTAITWADGSSENVEGGWQGPIPIDYTNVYIGYGLYVNFASRRAYPGRYSFSYSTASCTVTQERAASTNNENVACSNRGTCDTAAGQCNCYEGFYGHNCESQTILV